jgi:hypothetical protein
LAAVVLLVPLALIAVAVCLTFAATRLEQGSGHRLQRERREQPLAHELPYWEILEDDGAGILVGVDLTYSIGLRLSGVGGASTKSRRQPRRRLPAR